MCNVFNLHFVEINATLCMHMCIILYMIIMMARFVHINAENSLTWKTKLQRIHIGTLFGQSLFFLEFFVSGLDCLSAFGLNLSQLPMILAIQIFVILAVILFKIKITTKIPAKILKKTNSQPKSQKKKQIHKRKNKNPNQNPNRNPKKNKFITKITKKNKFIQQNNSQAKKANSRAKILRSKTSKKQKKQYTYIGLIVYNGHNCY